jgi:hypothetical protein
MEATATSAGRVNSRDRIGLLAAPGIARKAGYAIGSNPPYGLW